jgi:hypothetical protein
MNTPCKPYVYLVHHVLGQLCTHTYTILGNELFSMLAPQVMDLVDVLLFSGSNKCIIGGELEREWELVKPCFQGNNLTNQVEINGFNVNESSRTREYYIIVPRIIFYNLSVCVAVLGTCVNQIWAL